MSNVECQSWSNTDKQRTQANFNRVACRAMNLLEVCGADEMLEVPAFHVMPAFLQVGAF